jgi:hypothetical protein
VKFGLGAEKRRPEISARREYIHEVYGPLGDNGKLKMCLVKASHFGIRGIKLRDSLHQATLIKSCFPA